MTTAALPDLTVFFERYEAIAKEADVIFGHVREKHPEEVVCKEGCSSCCHALFDLSLVEAMYLKNAFDKKIPDGMQRFHLIDKASDTDRQLAKIKRKIFKDSQAGKENNTILQEIAEVKVRCPLLDKDDKCIMYECRPITCRIYGIPTSIGGQAHTCGLTGFVQGKPYPTVALDKLQERLAILSQELAAHLKTAYTELHLMYVPISSALITDYTAEYLGIGGIKKRED